MEFILELLLQFAGELVLQILLEYGVRGLAEPFRKDRSIHPSLALVSYLLLGVVGGFISLFILPKHLLGNPIAQYANLVVTPILMGYIFEWLGRSREARGKHKMLFDRFSYGFAFALAMGLIRFFFTA